MPTMAWGYGPEPVLFVRQHPGSPAVRLLLRGPDLRPFPAGHLRLLAYAIGQRSGPPDSKIKKVMQRLRAMADEEESPKGIVVDWSFRTNPQGRNRPGGQQRQSPPGSQPQ